MGRKPKKWKLNKKTLAEIAVQHQRLKEICSLMRKDGTARPLDDEDFKDAFCDTVHIVADLPEARKLKGEKLERLFKHKFRMAAYRAAMEKRQREAMKQAMQHLHRAGGYDGQAETEQ